MEEQEAASSASGSPSGGASSGPYWSLVCESLLLDGEVCFLVRGVLSRIGSPLCLFLLRAVAFWPPTFFRIRAGGLGFRV